MLDKDKLWVVYYLDMRNINHADWLEYYHKMVEHLTKNNDDSVMSIFIPYEEGHSKVECIYNPNNTEYDEKYSKFLEDAKNYIEKWEQSCTL